ncbi:cytochrome P450 [Phanerochaete sordida]|uniref:Cytochrome P450 n=1 Tax=Phanerochaete sordida TaxID=48140 RepID=A0A9P3GKP2_9APHY|nr:cytochrome P450 [Phanerochaete sordida]
MSLSAIYLLAGSVAALLLASLFKRRTRYPPGPPGLPLIGNLFDVPIHYPWVKYKKLGLQYIHFQVLGMHIVVLSSLKAISDVMEKQSNVTSDRPGSVMMNELAGWSRSWVNFEYSERWRAHRRLFHQHYRAAAASQYHTKQTTYARRLLQLLVNTPEEFPEHIRYSVGAMVIDIVYAFDVKPEDPLMSLVENAVQSAEEIVAAGVYLVDVLPILRYVPAWFPGALFKRNAARWKVFVDGLFDIPYKRYKELMQTGEAKPCFTSALLSGVEDSEKLASMDEMFASLTGTAYAAGTDTIVSTLNMFLWAMITFPEAQTAAHAALDRVLNRKRLPDIEDRDAIPYLTALLYEVMRWRPLVPLGFPHRTTAESYYNGFVIPAKTIVFGNTWVILQDESLCPEPHRFAPERFLGPDGALRTDVHVPVEFFGYGRRICPGRHFATDTLWLALAHILAVFAVEGAEPRAINGEALEEQFTSCFISVPKPFKCRFTPRFPEAAALIRSGALAD